MTTSTEVSKATFTLQKLPELKFGYFAELSRSKNLSKFRECINQFIHHLNLSDYIFTQLTYTSPPQIILNTLPRGLISAYFEADYFEYDMNLQRTQNNKKSFFHSTIHDYINLAPFSSDMTVCMNNIKTLNKSFDYYDFYSIPTPSLTGPGCSLLTVAKQGVTPLELQKNIEGSESTLQLLCEAIEKVIFQKFSNEFNITNEKKHQISINPKPLRVLSTLANNDYNINEVAEKLCISVVTVNQHLKTVRTSLGTKTNYAAIKQALLNKLIKFDTQPGKIKYNVITKSESNI